MPSVVLDTHAAVWYLAAHPSLSISARQAIDGAQQPPYQVFVPTICLVELTYLIEKGKLHPEARARLISAIREGNSTFVEQPLTLEVAEAVSTVSRESVPDLPDRIIAATAVALGVPLISRDSKIRAAQLTTIW
ncbi:MAG TPA: type II toxin-antitoxin system VapC family toxin [Bryobacteraceae bacterium]|nr:type II toxin-antitoxin system VapC family toxin [Bryobacteraceae bacterium]